MLKSADPIKSIGSLQDDNSKLQKRIDAFTKDKVNAMYKELLSTAKHINGIVCIAANIDMDDANAVKDLAFRLKSSNDKTFVALGNVTDGKASLSIAISDSLVTETGLDAAKIVRDCAKEIQGGGGGQAFYATAGGKLVEGLQAAVNKAVEFVK